MISEKPDVPDRVFAASCSLRVSKVRCHTPDPMAVCTASTSDEQQRGDVLPELGFDCQH